MRLMLAVLILLLSAAGAEAASFDCARAASPFEKAICADLALSRQDEVLATAYATALGGLSPAATTAMRAGQRDWLAYAERACSPDAEPIAGVYDDDQRQCLGDVFMSRIRDLEGSRMLEGRRFYLMTRYRVLADPEATDESWQKVALKAHVSPRLDGTDAEAAAFNAVVEAAARGPGGLLGEVEGEAEATSDLTYTTRVAEVTSRRIGLAIETYWFGHGAAHGNYALTNLHYLIEEQRALEADDIFAAEGWQQALAQLVFEALGEVYHEDALFVTSPAEIAEAVADPARWTFTGDGLVLRFQPYEVTAYAAGAPTVTIRWEKLRDYLAEDAEPKAYY
jgi:uncharacterized protein